MVVVKEGEEVEEEVVGVEELMGAIRMKAKLLNTTMVFSRTLCDLFATS